jgi:hypothetical protein
MPAFAPTVDVALVIAAVLVAGAALLPDDRARAGRDGGTAADP